MVCLGTIGALAEYICPKRNGLGEKEVTRCERHHQLGMLPGKLLENAGLKQEALEAGNQEAPTAEQNYCRLAFQNCDHTMQVLSTTILSLRLWQCKHLP